MTRVLGLSLAINGITRGEDLERPERLVRTMAYSNTIARSKWFAAALAESQIRAATTKRLEAGRARPVEVIHLDASASALQRNRELRRLASAEEDRALRIICNVKLFTEGVDVPNLNAVAFMDPRDSQVDVVQAVGRVMRKAPGKTLGYIVIPVIVEPGQNVADALEKTQEGYQTVGRVLRALQAHDERLIEDIARLVQVYEPNNRPPPGRGDRDDNDLQDVLDLVPASQEVYAHVAAASGLGRPGLLVAEQIESAVKTAATVFQSAEIEDDLPGVLGLAVDDEGGAKGICTIAALLLCNACLMHRRLKDVPEMRMLPGLGNVSGTNDPTSVLKAAWATILEQDYAPTRLPARRRARVRPARPTRSQRRDALCGARGRGRQDAQLARRCPVADWPRREPQLRRHAERSPDRPSAEARGHAAARVTVVTTEAVRCRPPAKPLQSKSAYERRAPIAETLIRGPVAGNHKGPYRANFSLVRRREKPDGM